MHMPIGVHCVLCISGVLGIFVLSFGSSVRCMMYGVYYIKCHTFLSCPVPVHCCLFLTLWFVVGCWCSWKIFPHLCVWISWWFFLFLGCRMWRCPCIDFVCFMGLFLFFCCIRRFSFCRRFCGMLLFRAVSCIIPLKTKRRLLYL